MKGISPLLASVLLIAFTLSVAAIVGGWFVSISKTETEIVGEEREKIMNCSNAILTIESVSCSSTSQQLKVEIKNMGDVDLYDFTTLTMINITPYTNNTGGPDSSSPLRAGATFILKYYCSNSDYCQSGLSVTKVRVSAGNCGRVYADKDPSGVNC